MSIVAPALDGARVLDLCAGSGALGLEALSRGAGHADFVEQAPKVLTTLRSNLATLGAEARATMHRSEAVRFLETEVGPVTSDTPAARRPVGTSPSPTHRTTMGRPPRSPNAGSAPRSQRSLASNTKPSSPSPTRWRRPRPIVVCTATPPSPSTAPVPEMPKVALYAGSFDPITNGHADLIRRSLASSTGWSSGSR